MKLQRIPSRLASIATTRLPTLQTKAGSTKRIQGSSWMATRRRIMQRDGYACQCCGIVRMDNEIDHRVPLEQSGSNEDGNLWVLCTECHKTKTRKEAQERAGTR